MEDINQIRHDEDELLDLPEALSKRRIREMNGGIVMCMLGIILLLLGARDGQLLIFGQLVTATIISSEARCVRSGSVPSSYDVYYSFKLDNKWHKGCFMKKSGDLSRILPGKRIEVRAMPDNPEISKPASQVNLARTLLKLFGGLACLGFASSRFHGRLV